MTLTFQGHVTDVDYTDCPTSFTALKRHWSQPGMLTRPRKSEAEVEAEAKCYEVEAEARDVA